jgi:hypothetical protein
MKDAYEVLRSKERAMENLRIEIMALRVAAPLLSDDGSSSEDQTAPTRPLQVQRQKLTHNLAHSEVERWKRGLPVTKSSDMSSELDYGRYTLVVGPNARETVKKQRSVNTVVIAK